MRLYHLMSAQYGLEALHCRRLRASRLNELNDPFELIGIELSKKEFRRSVYRWKDQLSKTKGIHCFSRRWSNPVLWSHYADKHRGVCLGFDVDDGLATVVNYQSKRLPSEPLLQGTEEQRERYMLKVLSTKFSHWRYEAEVRVFVELRDCDPQSGFFFTEFSREIVLRQVILGSECTLTRSNVQDAIGGLAGVEMFKARPAFKSFNVVKNRNEKLWR